LKHIVCFSGGKDSTAMLIHLIENNKPIDDIIYVDMGSWMWGNAKEHIHQVEDKLGVSITILDASKEIPKGFARWGFPSMFNRWCTAIKRELMKTYISEKYGQGERERESIVQYIGYCSDEETRTNKKLYSYYNVQYPLVEANITEEEALKICEKYGFDFGGVYEHHSHFNCWMCPLQKQKELQYLYNNEPNLWNKLRTMQSKTDGYNNGGKTIHQLEQKFWEQNKEKLIEEKKKARKKYNKRSI